MSKNTLIGTLYISIFLSLGLLTLGRLNLGSEENDSNSIDQSVQIVGGKNATIEEFPYQVLVLKDNDAKCGGTLITAKFVLTAAHGILDWPAKELSVRAGSSIRNKGGVVKQVIKKFEHENFNQYTYDYDIAILELESPFILGKTIGVKSIPPQDARVLSGWKGNVTGWGRLSVNGPYPTQLQKVVLPVLPRDKVCGGAYPGEITKRMFCAGYIQGGKDTCEGDSGGPFVYYDYVVGITSWGRGCAGWNSPGVFTKVSKFTKWIIAIINHRVVN